MFLPMILIGGLFFTALYFWSGEDWPIPPVLVLVTAEAVYVLLRLKSIVIWLVRVYQHYAPDDIRLACMYYPSCSEYMILAVEKYGPFRGVVKGIKRLCRCGSEPGGEDWP